MLIESAIVAAARATGLEPSTIVIQALEDETPGIHVNAEFMPYPASMIKVPLAMVAYRDVADGRLELDGRHEVTAANMTQNDRPSPLTPGYRASVRELIELMITISDNVATNMFFDLLGRERATSIAQKVFGLHGTAFHRKLSGSEPLIHDSGWTSGARNTLPAGDAARAFVLIARDRVPNSDALRATLGRQQFNDMLDMGLRPGDRFFHKTGGTDEVAHDGGILQTVEGRSYVIVVYSGLPSNDATSARFGPFMHRVREMM